jgi:hypothetical protein
MQRTRRWATSTHRVNDSCASRLTSASADRMRSRRCHPQRGTYRLGWAGSGVPLTHQSRRNARLLLRSVPNRAVTTTSATITIPHPSNTTPRTGLAVVIRHRPPETPRDPAIRSPRELPATITELQHLWPDQSPAPGDSQAVIGVPIRKASLGHHHSRPSSGRSSLISAATDPSPASLRSR